jgi:hypothetical protein
MVLSLPMTRWSCGAVWNSTNRPELPHERELVGDAPMLNDPAVDDVLDIDLVDTDGFAGRPQSEEVGSMRARHDDARNDGGVGRDDVLDRIVQIWERGPDGCHDRLQSGRPARGVRPAGNVD